MKKLNYRIHANAMNNTKTAALIHQCHEKRCKIAYVARVSREKGRCPGVGNVLLLMYVMRLRSFSTESTVIPLTVMEVISLFMDTVFKDTHKNVNAQ